MSNNFYGAIGLTGGTAGMLDDIDGAILADGDGAVVIVEGTYYLYFLDADSAAAESSPDVIAPDDNPGDKRWILADPSGEAGFSSKISAYQGTLQAVVTSTTTKVNLQTEVYDIDNEFASSRFTCTVAGYYAMSGNCAINDLGDGKRFLLYLYVNGAAVASTEAIIGGAGDPRLPAIADVNLEVDDYVELYVYHTHGTNRDTIASSHSTKLNIHRIG